jgi:hypothetical protein
LRVLRTYTDGWFLFISLLDTKSQEEACEGVMKSTYQQCYTAKSNYLETLHSNNDPMFHLYQELVNIENTASHLSWKLLKQEQRLQHFERALEILQNIPKTKDIGFKDFVKKIVFKIGEQKKKEKEEKDKKEKEKKKKEKKKK